MAQIVDKVTRAYERIEQSKQPEVWIHLQSIDEILAQAKAIENRVAAGHDLPLAGYIVSVKDNIDVQGMPTTAGAKSFTYYPPKDAHAVALLRAAGALIIGKNNLDQFATGLVGTRSPFGAVRNPRDLERISGGSSSGSAVAVALDIVDFALGTDTAGSGRVPAALNGIYGVKPSLGIVSSGGTVPACLGLDCVTVFAKELSVARLAFDFIVGPDKGDPYSRTLPERPATSFTVESVPSTASSNTIAIPIREQLQGMSPGWLEAFYLYVARVQDSGYHIEQRDISPLLDAALMLYGSSFVSMRYASVGRFINNHSQLIGTDLDPNVSRIILDGEQATAWQLCHDQARLKTLITQGMEKLAGTCALLTPTTTCHPTIEQVQANPIGINSRLGKYTNFCNLGDLAALAVPAGEVDGLPFGVMFTGPAFSDRALMEIAENIAAPRVDLFVVGAHRKDQVLNHEITNRGGYYVRTVDTRPHYRFYALDTIPPKPGMARVNEDLPHGIEGEIWSLSAEGFAAFVAALPQPMAIGTVELADGSQVKGFLCEPIALQGARDITELKSWLVFLQELKRTSHL